MNKAFLLVTLCVTAALAEDVKVSDSRQSKSAVQTRIASADMNKIFTEHMDKAPDEVRDRIQELQNDLNKRFMAIKKEKDNYDKQVAELQKNPEKATPALTEDLRKMRANLELEMQSAESYQMRAFQEFQAEYFPKIQKAAEAVAKRGGWHRVDFAPALYVSPEIDVTAEIIAELNKEYRAQKAAQKFKKN